MNTFNIKRYRGYKTIAKVIVFIANILSIPAKDSIVHAVLSSPVGRKYDF